MNFSSVKQAFAPRALGVWLFCLVAAPGALAGGLVLAPLQGLAALFLAPWRTLPRLARQGGLPLALFAAFLVWALLSALWSPERGGRTATHLLAGAGFGLLFATGLGFRAGAPESRWPRVAVLAFFGLILALGLIEVFGGMPFNRMAQPDQPYEVLFRAPMKGVTVLTVSCWAGAGLLWRGGRAGQACAALLLAGAGALALASEMDANVVAFVLGLIGLIAGFAFTGRAFAGAAFIAAAWLLASPMVLALLAPAAEQLDLPASWEQRAMIWRDAAASVAQRPLFGQGLGAFRVEAEAFHMAGAAIRPQHPHNAGMQIWFELGGVGAALAAAALAAFGWRARRALAGDRTGAAAATGCLLACAAIASLSFGLWAEWWLAALFAAAGFAACARRPG
ncbi:MAG: O-antigen ligase family protein [Hyphomonadaceae bacterium]